MPNIMYVGMHVYIVNNSYYVPTHAYYLSVVTYKTFSVNFPANKYQINQSVEGINKNIFMA